jgi:hypothetical protein
VIGHCLNGCRYELTTVVLAPSKWAMPSFSNARCKSLRPIGKAYEHPGRLCIHHLSDLMDVTVFKSEAFEGVCGIDRFARPRYAFLATSQSAIAAIQGALR